MTADQLDFIAPLVCPGEDRNLRFVEHRCDGCGGRIKRHMDWPAWQRFICVACFVNGRAR